MRGAPIADFVIYELTCEGSSLRYVGLTRNLKARFAAHRSNIRTRNHNPVVLSVADENPGAEWHVRILKRLPQTHARTAEMAEAKIIQQDADEGRTMNTRIPWLKETA
jgi:predicted GIY-YIG superfamily endonuclease